MSHVPQTVHAQNCPLSSTWGCIWLYIL